jgi:diacylglycerol kinase family enzyme
VSDFRITPYAIGHGVSSLASFSCCLLRIAKQLSVTDLAGKRRTGKRWCQRWYRAIMAAGGDSTIGTAVSLLVDTGIPLGILSTGTSNDVARALGIPFNLAALRYCCWTVFLSARR